MKLVNEFKTFMDETVNLNQTRIDLLEARVRTIKNFLSASDWSPTIVMFLEQGSWAHDTIIRPVDGGEFDADMLVKVRPVADWSASQYVSELGRVFRESGRYADKVRVYDFCVTVIYADDCKIDIAPLVAGREEQGKLEVCNRREDTFIESRPTEYTAWMRDKNRYSGNNSFRKATRLIKYVRDIKKRFSCQSVLLTTLIGHRIEWWDKDGRAFSDVPTALQSIMVRLDDWLQARPVKPAVPNPSMSSEDFADLWNETQYANFRSFVHKYRGWIDEAMAAETRADSVAKWRRVFGDAFAKDEPVEKLEAAAALKASSFLRSGAAHLDDLVGLVLAYGSTVLPATFRTIPHRREPRWAPAERMFKNVIVSAKHGRSRSNCRFYPIRDAEALPPNGGLWFDVRVNSVDPVPADCYVRWRITNTGAVAMALGKGRGDFYPASGGVCRWEPLEFKGVHLAEAFVIRAADDRLVGVSDPFHVVIQ